MVTALATARSSGGTWMTEQAFFLIELLMLWCGACPIFSVAVVGVEVKGVYLCNIVFVLHVLIVVESVVVNLCNTIFVLGRQAAFVEPVFDSVCSVETMFFEFFLFFDSFDSNCHVETMLGSVWWLTACGFHWGQTARRGRPQQFGF